MGIEESEDEDHDSDAVGDEGELGVVVNTLCRSPPRLSKTRANGFIRSQLASRRVSTAEVFEDDDARVIAKWESRRKEEARIIVTALRIPPPQLLRLTLG